MKHPLGVLESCHSQVIADLSFLWGKKPTWGQLSYFFHFLFLLVFIYLFTDVVTIFFLIQLSINPRSVFSSIWFVYMLVCLPEKLTQVSDLFHPSQTCLTQLFFNFGDPSWLIPIPLAASSRPRAQTPFPSLPAFSLSLSHDLLPFPTHPVSYMWG